MRAIDVLRTAGLAEDVTGAYFVEFPLGRGQNGKHRYVQAMNDDTGQVNYYRANNSKTAIPMFDENTPMQAILKFPAGQHGIIRFSAAKASVGVDIQQVKSITDGLKENFKIEYNRIEVSPAVLLGRDNAKYAYVNIAYPFNPDGTCDLSIRCMDRLLEDANDAFSKLAEALLRSDKRSAPETDIGSPVTGGFKYVDFHNPRRPQYK